MKYVVSHDQIMEYHKARDRFITRFSETAQLIEHRIETYLFHPKTVKSKFLRREVNRAKRHGYDEKQIAANPLVYRGYVMQSIAASMQSDDFKFMEQCIETYLYVYGPKKFVPGSMKEVILDSYDFHMFQISLNTINESTTERLQVIFDVWNRFDPIAGKMKPPKE